MAAGGHRQNDRARPRKVGRPPIHDEKWSKVSIVLFDRQLTQLDKFRRRLGKSGPRLNRAAIIRAALDAILNGTPPRAVQSEADLRAKLSTRRRAKPPGSRSDIR